MSKKNDEQLNLLTRQLKQFYKEFLEEKKANAKHREEIKPLLVLIEGGIVARKVFLFFTSIIIGLIGTWAAIKGINR